MFRFSQTELSQLATIPFDIKLGEGSYNIARLATTPDPGVVLKIAKPDFNPLTKKNYIPETDEKERSVRVYQEITGNYAYVINHQRYGAGWISPYYPEATTLLDAELIAKELVRIYKHTRRIILDGPSYANWRKKSNGEVICIDPGMALKRSGSLVSIQCWRREIKQYEIYWDKLKKNHPDTQMALDIILTLKYLESQLDDSQIKNEYIHYPVIKSLKILREKKLPISEYYIKALSILHTLDPQFITENTVEFLNDKPYLQKIIFRLGLNKNNIQKIFNFSSPYLPQQLKKIIEYIEYRNFKSLLKLLDEEASSKNNILLSDEKAILINNVFPNLSKALKGIYKFPNLVSTDILLKILRNEKLQEALSYLFDLIDYNDFGFDVYNPALFVYLNRLLPINLLKSLALIRLQSSFSSHRRCFNKITQDHKGELQQELAAIYDCLEKDNFIKLIELLKTKPILEQVFFKECKIVLDKLLLIAPRLISKKVIKNLLKNKDLQLAISWFLQTYSSASENNLKEILEYKYSPNPFLQAYDMIQLCQKELCPYDELIIHLETPALELIFPTHLLKSLSYLKENDLLTQENCNKIINHESLQKAIAAAYDYLAGKNCFKFFSRREQKQTFLFAKNLLEDPLSFTPEKITTIMQEWLRDDNGRIFIQGVESLNLNSRAAFAYQSGLLNNTADYSKSSNLFFTASSPIAALKEISVEKEKLEHSPS